MKKQTRRIGWLIAAICLGAFACIPEDNEPDAAIPDGTDAGGDDGSVTPPDGGDSDGGDSPTGPQVVCEEVPGGGLYCCMETGDDESDGGSDGEDGDGGDGADGGLDLFSCCCPEAGDGGDGGDGSDGEDGGAADGDGDGGCQENPYCCCGVLVGVAEVPHIPDWQPPSIPPDGYTGTLPCPTEGGDTWGVQDDGLPGYTACSGNLMLRYPWGTYNSRQAASADPQWRDLGMGAGWNFDDVMVSEAADPIVAGPTEHVKLYDQDLLQVGRWTRADDYPAANGGIRWAGRPGCTLSLTYYPASESGLERFVVYDPEMHSERIYLRHPLIAQRFLLSQIRSRHGFGTYFERDGAGRLSVVRDAGEVMASYLWDGDRVKIIQYQSVMTTLDYDSNGDLISATVPGRTDPYLLRYGSNHQLQEIAQPAEPTVRFGLDSDGRLSSVEQPYDGMLTTFSGGTVTNETGFRRSVEQGSLSLANGTTDNLVTTRLTEGSDSIDIQVGDLGERLSMESSDGVRVSCTPHCGFNPGGTTTVHRTLTRARGPGDVDVEETVELSPHGLLQSSQISVNGVAGKKLRVELVGTPECPPGVGWAANMPCAIETVGPVVTRRTNVAYQEQLQNGNKAKIITLADADDPQAVVVMVLDGRTKDEELLARYEAGEWIQFRRDAADRSFEIGTAGQKIRLVGLNETGRADGLEVRGADDSVVEGATVEERDPLDYPRRIVQRDGIKFNFGERTKLGKPNWQSVVDLNGITVYRQVDNTDEYSRIMDGTLEVTIGPQQFTLDYPRARYYARAGYGGEAAAAIMVVRHAGPENLLRLVNPDWISSTYSPQRLVPANPPKPSQMPPSTYAGKAGVIERGLARRGIGFAQGRANVKGLLPRGIPLLAEVQGVYCADVNPGSQNLGVEIDRYIAVKTNDPKSPLRSNVVRDHEMWHMNHEKNYAKWARERGITKPFWALSEAEAEWYVYDKMRNSRRWKAGQYTRFEKFSAWQYAWECRVRGYLRPVVRPVGGLGVGMGAGMLVSIPTQIGGEWLANQSSDYLSQWGYGWSRQTSQDIGFTASMVTGTWASEKAMAWYFGTAGMASKAGLASQIGTGAVAGVALAVPVHFYILENHIIKPLLPTLEVKVPPRRPGSTYKGVSNAEFREARERYELFMKLTKWGGVGAILWGLGFDISPD